MNPIEIKVPFPKYEGMEVKKVTADIENGYSVVEYGEKDPEFKKGDIVIYCTGNFTIIGDLFGKDQHEAILYALKDEDRFDIKFKTNRFISSNKPRIATPSEQQILFDALSKEGKKWNAEKLCIEDIEKYILVPESIGIYRLKAQFMSDLDNGDRLYIGFNDTQVLGYADGKYRSDVRCPKYEYHDWYEKVQCKLTPCKREELKEGDTGFHSYSQTPEFSNIHQYCKIIDSNYHVFVNSLKSVIRQSNEYPFWYKVEPIQ